MLTIGADLQIDQDSLRRKNEELFQAYRDKSSKQTQIQELYDKLKRRSMLGQVQNAASDAVDHTIQASVTANRFVDRVGNQNQRPLPPLFSNDQSTGMQHPGQGREGGSYAVPPLSRNGNLEAPWAGFNNQGTPQRMSTETPFVVYA